MKRFTTVVLLLALSGCGPSSSDTLVDADYDEQEMEAAISRARSEVDTFIAELSSPSGGNHAVKAPIEDGGEVEHFWLIDVSFKDGSFTGTINNEPGIVGSVSFGQSWTIEKAEISDWMFMRDGKLHGNYTMRPLMKSMPAAEAAKFRSMFADP